MAHFILITLMLFPILSHISYAQQTDTAGFVVYGEGTVTTPRNRSFTNNDFTVETSMPALDASSTIQWVIAKSSPARNETVVGILDAEGDITFLVRNNTYGTTSDWIDVASIGTTNDAFRGFDISYQQLVGDPIVVYEKDTTADRTLYYRTWSIKANGSGSWSAEQTISLNGDVAAQAQLIISLKSKPNSNDIMLVSAGTSDDISTARWNGTNWVNITTITLAAAAVDEKRFHVAWESLSGDAMLAFGHGGIDANYTIFDSRTTTWSAINKIASRGAVVQQISLCADPTSDYIGAIMGPDSAGDVLAMMWDGTQWIGQFPAEEGAAENVATDNAVCEWGKDNQIALFAYADTTGSPNMNYFVFNRTLTQDFWRCQENNQNVTALTNAEGSSGPCLDNAFGDDIEAIHMARDPNDNDIMLTVLSLTTGAMDVEMVIASNGTRLVRPTTAELEATASTSTMESADFAWISPDTTKPNMTFEAPTPANGSYAVNYVFVNITIIDNKIGISTCVLEWNGANESMTRIENTTDGRHVYCFVNKTGLSDANYTYKVWANDTANNMNVSVIRHANIDTTPSDTTPPEINFVAPTPSNGTYSVNYIYVNITATDLLSNIDTCMLEWNGVNETMQMNSSVSGTSRFCFVNKTALSDGNYSYRVFANDSLNNTATSATRHAYVDTTAPTITFIAPTPTNGTYSANYVYINVTATDTSNIINSCILEWNGVNETMAMNSSINGVSRFCFVNKTGLSDGNYSYRVFANDSLNNSAASTTRHAFADTTAPTVSYVSPTDANGANVSRNFVFINITASDASSNIANCILEWNGVNESMTMNSSVSGRDRFCWANKTSLSDGAYTYRAFANDTLNNTATGGTRTVTVDTTGPTVSFATPTPSNGTYSVNYVYVNVTVSDTATFIATCTLEWNGVNETMTQNSSVGASRFCFVNKTGLSDANYTYRVFANDSAGNLNASVTRHAFIDTTAPTISFVSPTLSDGTYALDYAFINVTVADASNSINTCTLEWNGVNESITRHGSGTSVFCSINKTGLTDDNYTYRVFAADTASNNAVSATRHFFSDDTVPTITYVSPSDANNAVVSRTFTFINITAADTNNIISACILEWNGANETMNMNGSITSTSRFCWANKTALTDGIYTYKVFANDSINNTAAATRNITIDTAPPSITIVNPTPANNSYSVSYVYVNITVSDATTSLDSCTLEWNGVNESLTKASSGTYCFRNKTGLSDTNYTYRVFANDTANNTNVSATRHANINVPRPPPPSDQTASAEYFSSGQRLEITRQDYFDSYVNWEFTKINNTHWLANYTVNQTLIGRINACRQLPPSEQVGCNDTIYTDFFSGYNKPDFDADLANISDYPVANMTDGVTVNQTGFDYLSGSGSFYIVFPDGFVPGKSLKFGFKSTEITATENSNKYTCSKTAGCVALTLNFTANRTGSYVILASGSFSSSSTDPDTLVNVTINTTSPALTIGHAFHDPVSAATNVVNFRLPTNTVKQVNLTAGEVYNISMTIKPSTANNVFLEYARIVVFNPNVSYYAENDTRVTTTGTADVWYLDNNFTITEAGDYLVLWSAVGDSSADIEGRVTVRWNGSATASMGYANYSNGADLNEKYSLGGFFIQSMAVGAHKINMSFTRVDASAGTIALQQGRILVMPLSIFQKRYFASDNRTTQTNSNVSYVNNTYTPTANAFHIKFATYQYEFGGSSGIINITVWNRTDPHTVLSDEVVGPFGGTINARSSLFFWGGNLSGEQNDTLNSTRATGTDNVRIREARLLALELPVTFFPAAAPAADTTAPTISFVSPSDADGADVTRNFTFVNITATDTDSNIVGNCTLEWDGINETMSINETGVKSVYCYLNKTNILQAGTHTYRVFANDSLNNTASSTRTINISVASISVHEFAAPNDRRVDLVGIPIDFNYYCYAGLGGCTNTFAQDTDGTITNFTIENYGNSGSGNIDVLLYSTSNLAANWYICASSDANDGDNSDCVSAPSQGANGADHVQVYNGSIWLNISSSSLDGTSYGLAIACNIASGNWSGYDFRVRVPNGIANTTFNASLTFAGYTDVSGCTVGNYYTP